MSLKNIRNEILYGSNSSYTSIVSQPYYYQVVSISFTGAIGPTMTGNCTFERIGKTVTLTYPTMHQFEQGGGGLIVGSGVPEVFWPTADRLISAVLIIHGSVSGGSSTSAVTTGVLKILHGDQISGGTLQWGTSINNASSLGTYGALGTNGSGNGVIGTVVTYSI